MANRVPQTALPGRSRSRHDELATGLGYFSIGLGLAEIAIPRTVRRLIGIMTPEAIIRGYGAREIATGVAILMSHDATPWVWGRVAGDALDVATVAIASPERHSGEARKPWALGALLAVTAIDLFCASSLHAEKGGNRTARA
ncbi:MAG: cyclase dehydrase, partial [Alphaproteobacteria bacterium]|nr:cyclase dehydrase [Alphaproteobacteria bacterium]